MVRRTSRMFCLLLALGLHGVSAVVRAQDTTDPLARALRSDSVYVGKALRNRVDAGALRALTSSEPKDRPLKIAVVNALPESGRKFGTRNAYTTALHGDLGLGRGMLIIVTGHGVSAATPALPDSRITSILQHHSRQIQSDPVAGLRATVTELDGLMDTGGAMQTGAMGHIEGASRAPDTGHSESPGPDMGGPPILGLIAVCAAGGVVVWAGSRAVQKGRAMREARLPVDRLRGEVVSGLSYADNYLDLLPDSPEATAARAARQQASDLYEQARGIARSARAPQDYYRAQALLESAREATALCRQKIDVATGGTGFAVAVDGTDYRATPANAGGTASSLSAPVVPGLRAEDIPPQERGACFFCSRPARITDLTPITIALNGQRRKVLACAEDVRIVQHGATPEVRTVTVNGRPVPWYSARHYDPYRDYSTTYVSYMPGYAGYNGMDDGFAEGMLLGALLSEAEPMPYPVFINQGGQAADSWQPAAGQGDAAAMTGVGGVDFFGDSGSAGVGSVSDTSNTNVGGVDFGNSVPDFSSTSIDTSSSFDSGSSSGGADFSGGSDFSSGGGDY